MLRWSKHCWRMAPTSTRWTSPVCGRCKWRVPREIERSSTRCCGPARSNALACADQCVVLFAHGKPRGTAGIQIRRGDGRGGGAHRLIVEPHAALRDQSTPLALGTRHSERDGHVDNQYRRAVLQSKGRQSFSRGSGKCARCGGRGFTAGLIAVTQPRRFGGENLLGDIDLGVLELLEPGDFPERQVREHAQEPPDI